MCVCIYLSIYLSIYIYFGRTEGRNSFWQELVHEELHDIFIRQRLHGTGIIEVAGQYRPLRHFASPERALVRLYTDVLATDIRLYTDILATDIYKQPIHR